MAQTGIPVTSPCFTLLCSYYRQLTIVVVLSLSWNCTTACPSRCTCSVDEVTLIESSDDSPYYTDDYRYDSDQSSVPERGHREVYCINRGLTSPMDPSSIPGDTYHLDLSENNIVILGSYSFDGLDFIQHLNLSGNGMTEIQSRAFHGLQTIEELDLSRNNLVGVRNSMFEGLGSLLKLNLSHNLITTIPSSAFERLHSLRKIDFQSKKLVCDCNLRWIVKWERNNNVRVNDDTVCMSPQSLRGVQVHVLRRNDMICGHPMELPTFELLPSEDQVVFVGDVIPLVCKATIVAREALEITWWKNGNLLQNGPNIAITEKHQQNLKTSTLNLSIGSDSRNEAWNIECKVSSSTGNVQKNVLLRILDGSTSYCSPSSTSNNKGNFDWPGLMAGASAELECPFGPSHFYSGPEGSAMAQRYCNGEGHWEDPLTGQCAFSDKTLQDLEEYFVMSITDNNVLKIAKKVEVAVSDAASISDAKALFFVGRFMEKFIQYPTQEVGRAMMNIASSMMEVNPAILLESQTEDRSCSKIISALEKFAADVLKDNLPVFHHETPHLAMQAHRVTSEGFVGMTCASFVRGLGKRDEYDERHFKCNGRNITSSKLNSNHSLVEAAIQLPASIFHQAASLNKLPLSTPRQTTFKLQFLVYKNARLFPIPDSNGQTRKVVEGSVISSKIDEVPFTNMTDQVVLTFRHSVPRSALHQLSPGYWNFTANNSLGDWMSNGCSLMEVKEEMAVLKCNHLTNFALLRTGDADESSFPDSIWSEYLLHPSIYITTFIFSILILLVLFSYICCYKSIRIKAKAKHSLMNICICLLILSLTFAGGINRTSPAIACKAVGMALHYFSTCCLLWLAIAARNLMKALSKSDQPQLAPGETLPPPRPIIRFYFVGWGVPMIIVGITAAASAELENYGGTEFCWISKFTISMASFFAVAALVSLVTCFFFIITTRRINISGSSNHLGRTQMYEIPSVPPANQMTDQFGSRNTMNSHHPPQDVHSAQHLSISTHLNMNSNANPGSNHRQSHESLSSVTSRILDQEKPHAKQLHSLVFLFLGFMGLWTLAAMIIIQTDTLSTIFMYLYSAALVIFGLFIFLSHCALRNDVLLRWKRLCGCSQQQAYSVSVPTDQSQHPQVNGHVIQRRPSASSVDSGVTNRSNNTNHSNPSYRSRMTSHCNYMPTNLHTGTDASIDSSTQETLPRPFPGDKRNGYGQRYNKSRNRTKNSRYSRHSRQSRDFSDGGTLPENARGHPPSSSGPSISSHRGHRNEFVTAVFVGEARRKAESAHHSDGTHSERQPPSSISKSLDQLRNSSHAGSMSSVEQAEIPRPKHKTRKAHRSNEKANTLPSPLPEEEPLLKTATPDATSPPSYEEVTEKSSLLVIPETQLAAEESADGAKNLKESEPALSTLSLNSDKKETSV